MAINKNSRTATTQDLNRLEDKIDRLDDKFDRKFDRLFYTILGIGVAVLGVLVKIAFFRMSGLPQPLSSSSNDSDTHKVEGHGLAPCPSCVYPSCPSMLAHS